MFLGNSCPALFFTVNIVGLDQLCTGSLNVAVTGEVTAIPVAPLARLVPVTVGGVVSVGAQVVNDHTLSATIAFPAMSFTPVVIVRIHC